MNSLLLSTAALASLASSAVAQCGDIYAGSWRNPPFGFDVWRNGVSIQFTPGVFDAPDQTPIAFDAAGNLYHAQTIDAQGTVRVYRNNTTNYTYGPRGGPSWVYSGLALAVQPDGSFYTAFYTEPNTVTVFRDGATVVTMYPAASFQNSPINLAWDASNSRLLVSIRAAANQVSIYDTAGPLLATYAAVGVPLAVWNGAWYTAVPAGSSSVQIYRVGTPITLISGAFTVSPNLPLAVDAVGSPFILVPVAGGQFAVLDGQGATVTTIPNTASGGGVGLAIYNSAPCPCYTNCDGSTTVPVLNVNDFVCFQAAFATGAMAQADCNRDQTLNVLDFACFQNAFAAGCP